MKAYKYDFVQIDLAIDNRSAQERVIPLAKDLGMAVLVNGPFGRNRVFQKTAGKPLPDWAKEIDATSWAQIALKYIVSNPAVTARFPARARSNTSPTTWARRADACPMRRSESEWRTTSSRARQKNTGSRYAPNTSSSAARISYSVQ